MHLEHTTKNLQFYSFIVLIAISLVMLFVIFRPFLSVLFFAVTLTVVFYPIHKRILRKTGGKEIISAVLSVLIILILILLPLIFISISLFQETAGLYVYITSPNTLERLNELALVVNDYVKNLLADDSMFDLSSYLEVREYIRQGLSWVIDNVSGLFSSFIKGFFSLFLMILAMFYFFKDGPKLKESLLAASPLSEEYSRKVLEKIGNALNSVIKGRFLIGIIQGIVAAFGLVIFSVPNPVLWGTTAAIFSVLPALGPMFVFIPAGIYLYLTGSLMSAIGIIIWGIAAVLLIDEYLSSILIDRGIKIHPFLILLSILGGLFVFGPIGFLLGPVSLALFFALLEIYPTIIKT